MKYMTPSAINASITRTETAMAALSPLFKLAFCVVRVVDVGVGKKLLELIALNYWDQKIT